MVVVVRGGGGKKEGTKKKGIFELFTAEFRNFFPKACVASLRGSFFPPKPVAKKCKLIYGAVSSPPSWISTDNLFAFVFAPRSSNFFLLSPIVWGWK